MNFLTESVRPDGTAYSGWTSVVRTRGPQPVGLRDEPSVGKRPT